MQNEKLLNALMNAKKTFKVYGFVQESVEHVMQTNNKIELAVGSIVLFNMLKEKLPQLSNEQLEEMLSYAFAKEDENLVKFIINNNIIFNEDNEQSSQASKQKENDALEALKGILPDNLIEAIKSGEYGVRIIKVNLSQSDDNEDTIH